MPTITPTYTESTVISAVVLARGSTSRATLDLRAKYGAWVMVAIGRGGTTALTNGVDVLFRRTLNNDAAGTPFNPSAMPPIRTDITAAAGTTCATSNSNAGSQTLNVALITGFAAGDIICIQDSGGGVTRLEYQRVSKTATGILTLDAPLRYTHTSAGADTVRNKAEAYTVWLDGGATWEIVVDYGDDSAGESVTIVATAQTQDSNVST